MNGHGSTNKVLAPCSVFFSPHFFFFSFLFFSPPFLARVDRAHAVSSSCCVLNSPRNEFRPRAHRDLSNGGDNIEDIEG